MANSVERIKRPNIERTEIDKGIARPYVERGFKDLTHEEEQTVIKSLAAGYVPMEDLRPYVDTEVKDMVVDNI